MYMRRKGRNSNYVHDALRLPLVLALAASCKQSILCACETAIGHCPSAAAVKAYWSYAGIHCGKDIVPFGFFIATPKVLTNTLLLAQ